MKRLAGTFLFLALSGCVARENDCNYCMKFCHPYEVMVCEQGPFGITCGCDTKIKQDPCPMYIRPGQRR